MKTSFTSLFVLLASAASLNIAYGQFAGIPECGETCIEASDCTDLSCLCGEQDALITCVYRTCPVEDRAGSQYIIRQECADAPAPSASPSATSPASASSVTSSAATVSSTSSEVTTPEETTVDSAPAETPAAGTPTTTPVANQPAAPSATNAPTRSLAAPAGSSSSVSGFVRSSSASRASTVVVVQTIGAGEDETGLSGGASSVKAGMVGHVAAVVLMGAGALLI